MKTRNPTVRTATAVALAVGAYVLVVDLLLQPLYVRGVAQGVLSHLNSLSALLAVPGSLLAQLLGLRRGHHTTLGVWWFILLTSVVLYAVGVALAVRFYGAVRRTLRRTKTPQKEGDVATDSAPVPAPRVSRRRVLTAGVGSLGAATAVGYPMSFASCGASLRAPAADVVQAVLMAGSSVSGCTGFNGRSRAE